MEKKQFTGLNRLIHSESLQMLKDKAGEGKIKEFLSDWKWIFGYTKQHKWIVVLYTVLGLLTSSASLLISYVWKVLINDVVAGKYRTVMWLSVALVSGFVFNIALNALVSRVSVKINIYVKNDIQASIFRRVIDARWSDIAAYQSGDLLNRFNSDVGTIAGNAVNWIPNILVNIYTFGVTFILLWQMDIIMALISLMAAPFLLLLSRYLMKKLQEHRKEVTALNSDMMSFESDAFTNYDMIKSFGIADFYSRRLSYWHKKYTDCNVDYNKVEIRARIAMSAMSSVVTLVAFGYSLYRLSTGQLLYGDMTFFLSQRSNVSGRFNSIVSAFPGLLNSAVSAHRIRELTELPPETHDPDALSELSAVAGGGITVEAEDVSFSYNENSEVYRGGSFVARPGEIVTILGPSGEGKTTLLRMILGLIEPEAGRVTLSGSDGKKLPVNADLRKLVSYVPQGNTTVYGTVAENMRMVKEEATDEEIVEALKRSCAWEFVENLPGGINARIGGNAHGISMGQAQRISIARALLRNSPILMLDEATSALDTDTERRVLQNIVEQSPNKTCIVSTHRPSIVGQSDRIYRVEDKRLVELDKEQAMQSFLK